MNKTSIKVIKRKDPEVKATAKTKNSGERKQSAHANEEQTARRSRREITGTILNWISERRENNCIERDEANGEIFGETS